MHSQKHLFARAAHPFGLSQHPGRAPRHLQHAKRLLAWVSLAGLAALSGGGALAQANPFYIGASQTVNYDSNFFRVPESGRESKEAISSTALLFGLDQPIGRQRLFADGALRANRYKRADQFDHTGGSLLAGLDWSAIDALSGRLSYATDKTLARYGADFGFNDASQRVLQTTEEVALRGQYGLFSILSIEGGYSRRELDFSVQSSNAFEQDAISLGLKYRPRGALTFGIGLRRTDGSYPFTTIPAVPPAAATVRSDDFERDDIDLSAVWVASGASTVTARLSRTSEKHQALPVRNVKGTTGAVAWAYRPTGKLNLTADWIRDTGAESSFNAGAAGGVVPTINSSPLATTWQLRGEYEVSAKVQSLARVRYFNRDLINNAGTSGEDTTVEYRLGLSWTPLRSVKVGCSAGYERRQAKSPLSTDYAVTTAQCLAEFKTQ